ncbi:MAG: hypothetical protein HKN29_16565, partial [Rhodothermales bacterium]|nr:hypothetical protein [Rhodothermales bacterium]
LNLLGKAVYVSGHVARVAGTVIETVVDGAATLIDETQKAFLSGLDPNVEDAKILAEFDKDKDKDTKSPSGSN